MPYLIARTALIAAAILILILRYRKTPGFGVGLWAFLVQLLPLPLSLLLQRTHSISPGWILIFPLIQIISAFLFLNFAGKSGKPKEPKTAVAWFNGSIILLLGVFLCIVAIGLAQHGSEILAKSGIITCGTILVLGALAFFGQITDKTGDRMSVAQFSGGILGMALVVCLLVYSGTVFYRASSGAWLSVFAQTLSFLAALLFLLASVGVLNCMSGHWVSVIGATGLTTISVFSFLVPILLRTSDWRAPAPILASMSYLPLAGWVLMGVFLF